MTKDKQELEKAMTNYLTDKTCWFPVSGLELLTISKDTGITDTDKLFELAIKKRKGNNAKK